MNRMTPQEKIASTLFLSLNNINYPQKIALTLLQYKRDDGLVALAWLASGVICFLYAYHDLIKLGIITM